MHWIDWTITIVPMAFVLWLAFYCKKYVRGVVDFLAVGRVARRYVISVSGMEAALSIVVLVALVEAKYQSGYALHFWEFMITPVGLIMSLTGYCVYRYRETKALSFGQFLEMRYNRVFRIFAAMLRTTAEMLTNAIGPAIAARFFVYFLGLPHEMSIFGLSIPMFSFIVGAVLLMALVCMWPAGRVAITVTDCIQGIISYPIFVIIVGYVLVHFSWSGQIAPVMMDRAAGQSFLNPFDIAELRDFNIFAIIVTVFSGIINRASWYGNDTGGAARTPHEQKMAGILGTWRGGFSSMMGVILAISVITFMAHKDFAPEARKVRLELSNHVARQVVADPAKREQLLANLEAVPLRVHTIGSAQPLSVKQNEDTPYLEVAANTLGKDGQGNLMYQKFRTLYHQMMMPITMRHLLPVGIAGAFCLLMVMLMLSTDDARIFNSAATIVQDIVMPLRKNPLTPTQHLRWLRITSLLVCIFFFLCSLFFVNVDYIQMFTIIMTAIWMGGAGPVMIFGLYSKFGNTVGAFASLLAGSGLSTAGVFLQRNWAKTVYPYLDSKGWVEPLDKFLRSVSEPLSPYVVWHMNPVKFPINSYEVLFIAIFSGVLAYVIGSLVAYRHPYNLERLLHRGKYSIDGDKKLEQSKFKWWSPKAYVDKILGISPEFTRGDKILSWSVFLWTFVFHFGICFIGVLVWNMFWPWPLSWWSMYFYINSLLIAAVVGVITTVWFMIGGIKDTRHLFRDLAARVDNPLDDGRVKGHVSLVDVKALGKDAEG